MIGPKAAFNLWNRYNYVCGKVVLPSTRTPEDKLMYIGFLGGAATAIATIAIVNGIDFAGYSMDYNETFPFPRFTGPGGTEGFDLVGEGYISALAVVRAVQNNLSYRTV